MESVNIFEKRMKAILGDEYESFERAITGERVKALRLNPLKEQYPTDTSKIVLKGSSDKILWEQSGVIYTDETPGKHPHHEAGVYYIQEPSAMAPVHFLDPKPGEKILDLCAAPGGKSTQIAARMKGEGILVTNEIDRKRAQILSLNIERMGVTNALVTNMSPEKLSSVFEGYFDKILVDAPCSGEGMFRKNDEAMNQWSPENVRLCSERQKKILDEALKMLATGGRLVYSTCTFAPEEDEESVLYLLRKGMIPMKVEALGGMKRADASNMEKILSLSDEAKDTDNALQYCGDPTLYASITDEEKKAIPECAIRLWPHHVQGEGHFLAVFEKSGDISLNSGLYPINGSVRCASDDEISLFTEFTSDTLNDIELIKSQNDVDDMNDKKKKGTNKKNTRKAKEMCIAGRIRGIPFMFGEQLYLAPCGMPGIDGLNVMRPGLHLGTIRKNRIEPSHSLALVLSGKDVSEYYDVPSGDAEVMQFIGGQSIRVPDLKKGWVLITTDGFGLGWAKYAGGVLKNHYPKGLRIYT